MSKQRSQLITHIACCLAAAILLLAVTASPTLAQQKAPVAPPPGAVDPKREQRQRELRETILRSSEMEAAVEKRDQKRIEAAIKQVQEDFKQIQIVRNEIARAVLANKPLDYKFIANEAGEINKHADRLKKYLLPPAADDEGKNQQNRAEINDREMKGALVQLCKLVDSFVENPVLKAPGTTDVEQSTRAGGDLLRIVELSGNIKRNAERLNKTSK